MIQLDFFDSEDTHLLRKEIEKLKESNDRVRRSLFAKHGELAKNYIDLLHRMDILERSICKGTPTP